MAGKYLITGDGTMGYWPRTKPHLEAYADKIGAELIVLPPTKLGAGWWVLFDAFAWSLKNGDPDATFIWIDSDIMPTRKAKDLFEFLPDRFHVTQPNHALLSHKKWRHGCRRFGVLNARPYPNTSIVRWSRRHVEELGKYAGRPAWFKRYPRNWGDQEVLAHLCHVHEVFFAYLPLGMVVGTGKMKGDCQFLHACGSHKRRKFAAFENFMQRRDGGSLVS